jgi:hypothetical protein
VNALTDARQVEGAPRGDPKEGRRRQADQDDFDEHEPPALHNQTASNGCSPTYDAVLRCRILSKPFGADRSM